MSVNISLEKLIESGAHFGHQSRRWNPKMEEYLYGVQDGVHVFDLTKTKAELETALDFLTTSAKEGKVILFLGTKKQAKLKIKEVAEELGAPYVNERWLGGTMTNFEQIKKSIDKLKKMKEEKASGEYKKFTKKERGLLDREIERLERFFGGITGLTEIPSVIFVIDIKREAGALIEANQAGLTSVAIVDSNCDPTEVDYPIPMNDDATQALEYVLDLAKEAILEGKKKVKKEDK